MGRARTIGSPMAVKASVCLAAALIVALVAPAGALAGDTWTEPYPGVQHLFRVTGAPNRIHVLVVDLGRLELRMRATPYEARGSTPSKFAKEFGCSVATNGDFGTWDGDKTSGLAMGYGEAWPNTKDNKTEGFIAFGVDNRATIQTPSDVMAAPESWMHDVIGGRPLVVVDGEAVDPTTCDPHFCQLHPRTAIGLSEDAKTLFWMTVDGRSPESVGMTTRQVGDVLAGLGAYRALNLDGGGSTAMYVEAEGGIVNVPSGPPTAGVERLVANQLGLEIVEPIGDLEGRVVTERGGAPVSGASVTLGTGATTTTDVDGRFAFPGVAAGPTTVTAGRDAFDDGSVDVFVAAAETTSTVVALAVTSPDVGGDGGSATTSAAAASGSSASSDDTGSAGCACRAASRSGGSAGAAALLGLAALLALRRRTARRRLVPTAR